MKRLLCILLITILVFITGCSFPTAYQKNVFNDNTLLSFEEDSYTYDQRVGQIERFTGTISFQGFYGSDTLWDITAVNDGELTIILSSTITNGDYKVVIVDSMNNVETLFEGENEYVLEQGQYKIKMIGKGAAGSVAIVVNDSDNIIIIPSSS